MKILVAASLLSCALAGCTTAERVQSHATLATSWKHVTLYQSNEQFAYATSAGAADELNELAASVALDFKRLTATEPATLIMIARDVEDPPFLDDFQAEFTWLVNESAAVFGQAVDAKSEFNTVVQQMTSQGVDPAIGAGIRPFIIRTSALSESAEGEQGAESSAPTGSPYAAILPTTDYLDAAIEAMMAASMKRERVTWAQRLLLAPMMPSMKSKMRRTMLGVCRATLFSSHAKAQGWTDEESRKHVDAYVEQLGLGK